MGRNGITPVIAVVLLLMMTVAAAGGAYAWTSGLMEGFFGRAEAETQRDIAIKNIACFNQAPTAGDGAYVEVYFSNTGTKKLDLQPVDMHIRPRDTGNINYSLTRTGISLTSGALSPMIDFQFGDGFASPGTSSAYIIGLESRFESGKNYEIEFVFTDEANTKRVGYCQAQTGGTATYDTREPGTNDTQTDPAAGVSIGLKRGSFQLPTNVSAQDVLVASVMALNNGSERGTATVTFTVDDDTGTVRSDTTDVTLDPGESRDVSTSFDGLTPGVYTVTASCSGCSFNGQVSGQLTVTEAPNRTENKTTTTGGLRLRSFTAPGSVEAGGMLSLEATLENMAEVRRDVELVFTLVDAEGSRTGRSRVTSTILAGQQEKLTATLQAPSYGTDATLSVSCAACNGTGRLSRQVAVQPPPRPEVGIQRVDAPASADSSSNITVQVTLRNQGEASASRRVVVTLLDNGAPRDQSMRTVEVGEGGSRTATFTLTTPETGGNLSVEATCMDCEASNRASARLTVAAPATGGGLPIALIVVVVVVLGLLAALGYYLYQRSSEEGPEDRSEGSDQGQPRGQQFRQGDRQQGGQGQRPPRQPEGFDEDDDKYYQ